MNAVTLTLTAQELQVLNDGLFLMPYGRAKPVVDSINAQIQKAFDTAREQQSKTGASAADPEGQ